MPAPDLALLTDVIKQAGVLALQFWKAAPKVWEKPGQGPVSEADIAVNDLLQARLRTARPDYGWLSEESPDTADRLSCEHVFILDPIDGTRTFIAGETHFSISVAIAHRGRVTAAAVLLPALGRLYSAEAEGQAFMNGSAISVSTRPGLADANLLMSKSAMAADHWRELPPGLTRSFRSSIAYRLCLVAEGAFDGMISLRDTWEWDIAGGSLIAERAGAVISDKNGRALRFNAPEAKTEGILAATPAVHAGILASLIV